MGDLQGRRSLQIAGPARTATFSSFLHIGDGPDRGPAGVVAYDPSDTPDFHIVIRSHGPQIPGEVQDQLGTYEGDCDVEVGPPPGQSATDFEIPDEPGECADIQLLHLRDRARLARKEQSTRDGWLPRASPPTLHSLRGRSAFGTDTIVGMCRNIRPLHNFEPPATDDEIRAAALQYVRKVSGYQKPSVANEDVFVATVDAVAAATRSMLGDLVTKATPRDREAEAAKARARAAKRYGTG